jgi:hypothetical protein
MSGRHRLHGGRAAPGLTAARPTGCAAVHPNRDPLAPSDRVLWRGKTGYRRVNEENAFIEIGERIYRVRRAELRQG